MKYVKGFDTIRAVAVLIVILGHWGLPFSTSPALSNILDSFIQYGRFGVTIFFVLSGFLITSILLNEKFKTTYDKRFTVIKNFFARRVLRIFPIYYLLLLIIFLVDPFVRSHIWYYLFYSSNLLRGIDEKSLPHFWTLAVEEQFYVIWPWLILLISKKHLKYVFLFFIAGGIVSQYLSNNVYHLPYGFLSINCFDSFGIGAIYAWVRLDKARCVKFEQYFRIILPLMLFIAWKMGPVSGLPLGVIYVRFLDNVIALAMIMFAINNQAEWIRKYLMENRALNFIGKISYGIYLYHFSFGLAYFNGIQYLITRYPSFLRILPNDSVLYVIKLGLLIFICWLSYRFIEQPILRLKKRFEYS